MSEHIFPQETAPNSFETQYKRILEVAECSSQVELAALLEIRQSSVSDAKRRESVPAEWRVKLFEKKRVNPEWILHGEGPKYLAPTDAEPAKPHVVHVTEIRPPKECSFQELFAELVRRVLEPLNTEAIQKEVAGTWLPVKKANDER